MKAGWRKKDLAKCGPATVATKVSISFHSQCIPKGLSFKYIFKRNTASLQTGEQLQHAYKHELLFHSNLTTGTVEPALLHKRTKLVPAPKSEMILSP